MRKHNKGHITKLCFALGAVSIVALGGSLIEFNAKANTFYVDSVQSFVSALSEEGTRNIVITEDFAINQTIELNGDINISSNADVKITRENNFLSDMFLIGEGSNVKFQQTQDYTLIFDGNAISCEGVAFKTSENSTLSLNSGIEITNFDSLSSGAVIFNNGELVIDGSLIYSNKLSASADKFGIIHNYSGSSLKIKSGEIYNNTTSTAGMIFMNNGSEIEMTGGKIYNNTTTSHGGGLFVKSAEVKLAGGEIYSNSAVNGGGIYLKDSADVEITGTKIHKNTSSEYGAGCYLTDTSKIKLNGGEISNNISTKSGAGLFITSDSQFEMVAGTITLNQNQSGNGGAFVNKSIAKISGGTISKNTAVGKGGAIYNDTGSLYISNATVTENTAGTFGGAVCNEEGNVEITSGTFTKNSAENGGAICGYSLSQTLVKGGTFTQNTATNRGNDAYGAASSTSKYATLTLTGGEFGSVNIQYCKLEIGGSLKVNDTVTTNAGKKAGYAYVSVVSELENNINFTPHSSVVAEEKDTSIKFVRYDANDDYSNIYRTARKISFSNDLYTAVEDGIILVQTGEHKIDISAEECVVDVPLAGSEGQTITFSALDEYQISNVNIKAKDGSVITTTKEGDKWSFVMPTQDVIIDYDFTLIPLTLTVESEIENLVEVENSYNFKENVSITIKDNDSKKVTNLYINYKQGQAKLEIKDGKANFKMFKGATVTGDVKNYYDITFENSEYIQKIDLSSEKTNKGLEGEEVLFTITTKSEAKRYAISRVYYLANQQEIDIIKNDNGQYCFTMPSQNIQIKYEFVDIFQAIEGEKVEITTESQLKDALTGESKILIVCEDIVLNETIVVGEGEYTIISLGDHKISRSNTLKKNMFEVGFKSTLNLSFNNDLVGLLTIDGNSASTQDVVGSAIFTYESGTVNINKNTIISNHKLESENFNYTEKGQGNSSAGGSAVYNYHGVVNMYGGEIKNNYSSKNGSAIYNYGRFNLYGGYIKNNSGKVGGTIYNIRVFNQEGGVIEGNSTEAYGGAIYNANSYYAYIYLIDGEVKNNTALISGGAYYIGEHSVAFCKGGLMAENIATINGGAINSKGTLFAQGTNFEGNIAGSKGGAIYGYLNPIFVRGGTFEGNKAKNGGAVCVHEGVELEITAGEFINNTAEERGGAVYLAGDKELSQPTIANVSGGKFTGNIAPEGDAICVQYAVLSLSGQVSVEGTIETVANPTKNYGFIQFDSVLTNQITVKPNKYFEDYQNEEFNVLRVSQGVDAQALAEKIILSNNAYDLKVDNNQIYIFKIV